MVFLSIFLMFGSSSAESSNLPPLKGIAPAVVEPGESFTVQIQIGEENAPIEDLFGVAFRLQYQYPEMVKAVEATAGPLLGDDLVFFQNIDDANGEVSIGITKKRGQEPVQGSGIVVIIDFTTNQNAQPWVKIALTFTDATASNPEGGEIEINPESTEFVIGYLGAYCKTIDVTNSDVVVGNFTVNASLLSNAVLIVIQHGKVNDAPVTGGETFGGIATKRAGVVWEVIKLAMGSVPSATANLIFSYAGVPGISNENTLRLLKRDNATDTNWKDVTSSATLDMDANTFTQSNQTSFSQYTIGAGNDNSLPVILSSFTADVKGDVIVLHWRTETEINNLGFIVYRSDSKDGKYIKIGRKDGAGNSSTPFDYQFLDEEVEIGKRYFYYIEDIDIVGSRSQSEIVKAVVPFSQKEGVPLARLMPMEFRLLQNYPNPFNPETWIPYQLASNAQVIMRIYNVRGNLVRTMNLGKKAAGVYFFKDKAAHWEGKSNTGERVSSGVFFYQLQAGKFSAVRKMIIVK